MNWNFFTHIYLITLETSEFKEIALEELENVGIKKDKIKIISSKRDLENGARGCFNSHQKAIREAYNSNAKMALIFEDDIKFIKKIDPIETIDFLTKENWDIFYLGHFPFYLLYNTKYKNIIKTKSYFTHAYIINKNYMKKILELNYEDIKIPIDNLYYKTANQFAIYPQVVIQKPHESTITKINTNFYQLSLLTENLFLFKNIIYIIIAITIMILSIYIIINVIE